MIQCMGYQMCGVNMVMMMMSDTGFLIGGVTYFLGVCMVLTLMLIAAWMYGGLIAFAVIAGIVCGVYFVIKGHKEGSGG
jgi:VIT1/CCC1 family predicted Fe2+/Mn2+ transporter